MEAQAPRLNEEVLLERWTEIESKANKEPEQLYSVGESFDRGHQAFDAAALEVPFEEQALVCTIRVQDALRSRSDLRLALELLRPARLLWPNKFGARPEPPAPPSSDGDAVASAPPEDPAARDLRADLEALREIFMVDLSAPRADLMQRLGAPVQKLLVLPSEGTYSFSLAIPYTKFVNGIKFISYAYTHHNLYFYLYTFSLSLLRCRIKWG